MKLLILSDCHANLDSLNAVWSRENDCDYIIFAGDMIDFGFHPRETVHWFMERKDRLFAVRGNHDEEILAHRYDPVSHVTPPGNFQELTYQQMTEEEYDFLQALPHERCFTLGDTDFYLCHTADELTPDGEVCYAEQRLADHSARAFLLERFASKFPGACAPKKCMVYGHSHLQWAASAGPNNMILNPGSLSYHFGSFEPVRCADYIVLEDGAGFLKHMDFDTQHLYNRAGSFSDPEAARLARAFFRRE